MTKRGRKGQYDTLVKPFLSDIEEMSRTLTERQIAKKLGVGYSTWNKYKNDNQELKEALKKGHRNLVDDLRSTLIKKAIGYRYTEVKEKTKEIKYPDDLLMKLIDAGFTSEELKAAVLVERTVAIKEMPPDVAAINLALKNYDRGNWSNDWQTYELRQKELELRQKQVEANTW